jgi:hypothetical protein
MKKITREMLHIYKPYSGLDWLNYRIVRKDMTAHHIIKRCDGGRMEMCNVALLMPISHEYLHLIECVDKMTYELLNRFFLSFISQLSEPSKDQREIIEYVLRDFESAYKTSLNSKGRPLIKEEYLNRCYHL